MGNLRQSQNQNWNRHKISESENAAVSASDRLSQIQASSQPTCKEDPTPQPRFRGLSQEWVQAKLTVGQSNDSYEQEADRVAAQIVQQINQVNSPQIANGEAIAESETVHLMCKSVSTASADGMTVSDSLETTIQQQRGKGDSIADDIREPMEKSFGVDFSDVRIHVDHQSDELNRSIQARAFTTGQDIFFKQGGYQPRSRQGQELLAHELVHVLQQSSSPTLQSKLQRSEADGYPDAIYDGDLTPTIFLENTKIHVGNFKRGKYLETIDKWLAALHKAQTWDAQQYALAQVATGCQVFLNRDRHQDEKVRSQVNRTMAAAVSKLDENRVDDNSQVVDEADKSRRKRGGRKREALQDTVLAIQSGTDTVSSVAGGVDDVYKISKDTITDTTQSGYLDTLNLGAGGLKVFDSAKTLFAKDSSAKDRINAGGDLVAGLTQTGHGTSKIVKIGMGSDKGEALKRASESIGEISATVADSGGGFAALIATGTGLYNIIKHYRSGGSRREMASLVAQETENVLVLGQSAVKSTSGGLKSAAARIGESANANTVSGLATAASVLSIVVGTVQIAQGGLKMWRAYHAQNKLSELGQQQAEVVHAIAANLADVESLLPEIIDSGDQPSIDLVLEQMLVLVNTLKQLQQIQQQSSAAAKAMEKITNRRMEEGTIKAVEGVIAVTSGGLILSGAGAPFAIAIGAIGGVMALGYAGINWQRNRKADSLMGIAERINDDGIPKAKPDPKVDYRLMEDRIYKCYYNHLSNVLKDTQPAGMDKDEFKKVKYFAWEDKKDRVDSQEKYSITHPDNADGLPKSIKRDKWIEVHDRTGKVTHHEKPKGIEKAKYTLSFSAHKSRQSLDYSREELAGILTDMCLANYYPELGAMEDAAIQPVIQPDEEFDQETIQAFRQLTVKHLLSAAEIKVKQWQKWYEESDGERDKIQQKVLKHLSK